MLFPMSAKESEALDTWTLTQKIKCNQKRHEDYLRDHLKPPQFTPGILEGLIDYIFTPNNIGTTISARNRLNGESIDVTDWESW